MLGNQRFIKLYDKNHVYFVNKLSIHTGNIVKLQ